MSEEIREWIEAIILWLVFFASFVLRAFLTARRTTQTQETAKKPIVIPPPSSYNPVQRYTAATHISRVAHEYYQTILNISPAHPDQDDETCDEKRFRKIHNYFNHTLSENIVMFPEKDAFMEQTKLMRSITYADIKNNIRKGFEGEYDQLVKILTPYIEK